jgi:hypothetical protein
MGQWVMHIEGHGIHDNGRADDADVMLREFVEKLCAAGQSLGGVSFTVGATKTLTTTGGTTEIAYAEH